MFNIANNDCQLVYTAPAGHKISKIDLMKSGWQTSTTAADNFNNLLITPHIYKSNTAGDVVMKWDGFGKIVGVDWKNK